MKKKDKSGAAEKAIAEAGLETLDRLESYPDTNMLIIICDWICKNHP